MFNFDIFTFENRVRELIIESQSPIQNEQIQMAKDHH